MKTDVLHVQIHVDGGVIHHVISDASVTAIASVSVHVLDHVRHLYLLSLL